MPGLHEPKLDGYRFQIVKDGRQVKLYSRNGHEWTKRLASLAEALQAIHRYRGRAVSLMAAVGLAAIAVTPRAVPGRSSPV